MYPNVWLVINVSYWNNDSVFNHIIVIFYQIISDFNDRKQLERHICPLLVDYNTLEEKVKKIYEETIEVEEIKESEDNEEEVENPKKKNSRRKLKDPIKCPICDRIFYYKCRKHNNSSEFSN